MDVHEFINEAIEASLYVAPRDHGLTEDELVELGGRFGFGPGAMRDAVTRTRRSQMLHGWEHRLRVHEDLASRLADFNNPIEPEQRDWRAFEFVRSDLQRLRDQVGIGQAKMDRQVLIARAIAAGHTQDAVDVAIEVLLIAEHLVRDAEGLLAFASGKDRWIMPSEQRASRSVHTYRRKWLGRLLPEVRDVIARRSDKRAPAAHPLDALETMLDGLGHGRFRAWWTRIRCELARANAATDPVTVCVLAAALVEGALALVVARAKALGVTMNTRGMEDAPTRWKLEDLVKAAASGGPHAILDQRARDRGLELNTIRQRIHAGRLLHEHPNGPLPDTRPEDATLARETAEIIVRRVVDWILAHPAPAAEAVS